MNVIQVTHYSEKILNAINELLPQLSSSAKPLTESDLTAIIESESSHFLVVEENGQIYGSVTLVVFKIPTGTRAWVEDVVVDSSVRGKGVGKILLEKTVSLALKMGAKTIDLTSRPSRETANALYRKVGFDKRETNVYRHKV